VAESDIFVAALGLEDPGRRLDYLTDACGTDTALRNRVEGLLNALNRAGDFLQAPLDSASLIDRPPPGTAEAPGIVIGPYTLVEQIGEGGMGVVFVADQQHPVRRRVALKAVKPGMDTRAVLARFEAERQVLALMEHPNIARVFDAGTTEHGRPYFVMELVRGVPITEFCDSHRLTIRERLGLFVPVCEAVRHAHQKGIIHRDIKPSNVLVETHDGRPVPKVIDFGIAMATGGRSGDTAFIRVIGTPRYMSPEQAGGGPDVDTRTDVYALGVLLYELLTGTTPLDGAGLDDDVPRRDTREQQPSRPSSRLSALGPTALAVPAGNRGTGPRQLVRAVRGALDWVVMKCIEKDRNRRYETADALALDVERYLRDESVVAGPPSVWYRLRTYTRRNRAWLVGAAMAVSALVLLGGGVGWVVRDRFARQAKLTADLQKALDETERCRRDGHWPQAQAAAKRAEELLRDGAAEPALVERTQGVLRALAEEEADRRLVDRLEEMRLLQSEVKDDQFVLERALPDYQQAFREYGLGSDIVPEDAAARLRGRPAAIRSTLVAALDHWLILARHKKAPEAAWLMQVLAVADTDSWQQRVRAARERNDLQAMEQLAREVDVTAQPPEALFLLDMSLRQRGAWESAVAVLRRARDAFPGDFWINRDLGMTLLVCPPPQYDEAIRFLTAAVALRPRSSGVRLNLGNALWRKGRLDEATAAFRQAIDLKPDYALAHRILGRILLEQGKVDEAAAAFRRDIALKPEAGIAHFNLGTALDRMGRPDEAVAAYRKAIDRMPEFAEAHCNLGHVLWQQGNFVQALAALQRGHELGTTPPIRNWPYPSAQWVRDCQRMVDLDGRLPAVLRAAAQPADASERNEYARVCYYKKFFATSARMRADAFRADPQLADDLKAGSRYEAACAAALYAAGQGGDAGQFDDHDQFGWRKQALDWLRADLTANGQLVVRGQPEDRRLVRQRLQHWQSDQNLASLRDPAVVARLTADEQEAWRQFWADVQMVLGKADAAGGVGR
jgi:serine/threonine protein kinase/Flp pilus assembly protein TadD